ncbi:MAG: molybdopterin-dependent oxidoreductase, partial [Nitrososphaerales archaeon]
MSSSNENVSKKAVSRRNMLKWTGALAAAGIVGIGLGFGGDLLARPNTTTTKTSTVTATTTQTGPTVTQTTTSVQTPAPLSYIPPLSASAAARVQQIIQDKVAAEKELTLIPYISPRDDAHCGLHQIAVKNGAVVGVRPEAPVIYPQPVPQFAREDAHMTPTDVFNFKIGDRLSESNIAHPYNNYEADRVIYPMQRVPGTPRATTNGSFVRISWSQAISTIANQMQTDFTKYGPYFVNIGGQRPETLYPYIFGGCSFKEYGSVSFGTNQVGANQFYGVNPGYNESLGDIQYSKLIIIWGYDPVAIANKANTHYLTRFAKEQGIPVIVIDPRYSISAEVMGSQWIPIRTTTDIQMMCAVANVLFTENLWNQAYVSKYVEPTGFAAWKSYILGQTAGPDGAIARTPEWAAPICGVPAATIRALAELYGKSNPTYLVFSSGAVRQYKGINQMRVAMYLQAMTGNIGVHGGYMAACPSWNSSVGGYSGSTVTAPALASATRGTITYVPPYLCAGMKLADAILLNAQYQSGAITKEQFYLTIGNNASSPAPNCHFMMDTANGTRKAGGATANNYKQVKMIAAVDMYVNAVRVMNPQAQLSDIILPLTEDYEDPTIRFQAIEKGFVYQYPVIAPQGEARS